MLVMALLGILNCGLHGHGALAVLLEVALLDDKHKQLGTRYLLRTTKRTKSNKFGFSGDMSLINSCALKLCYFDDWSTTWYTAND